MANPYQNDIVNLRSNIPGSTENSPMKQPASHLVPHSAGFPPLSLPGQSRPQAPPSIHHSIASNQWHHNQQPTSDVNGHALPGGPLRGSPQLARPQANMYLQNRMHDAPPTVGQITPSHSSHAPQPPSLHGFAPSTPVPSTAFSPHVGPMHHGRTPPGTIQNSTFPTSPQMNAATPSTSNHAPGILPPTYAGTSTMHGMPNQYGVQGIARPPGPPMYGRPTVAGPPPTGPSAPGSYSAALQPPPPSGASIPQFTNAMPGKHPPPPQGPNTLPHQQVLAPPLQSQPAGNQLHQSPMVQGISRTNQPPPHGPHGFSPAAPGQFPYSISSATHGMRGMAIDDKYKPVDIMQERCLVARKKQLQKPLRFDAGPMEKGLVPPNRKNCNPEVFRSTLNKIPVTQALLNKVKLPLGLIIHPFKDLSSLPVISAGTIVRCKRCRTYINPFVDFLDERTWRCNLCFVTNEAPEEFLHHPVSKTYGQPHTRPECTNSTLEFIAPQEYMVRPPQPAVYMFLFDVSHAAVETGYLQIVCDALLEHIDHLPGDARTKIGFLSYNGTVHFYRLAEGASQPQMMIVTDLDDIFLPTPDSLLVNLRERKDLVCDLLRQLPEMHAPPDNLSRGEIETQSALGAALQASHKLMCAVGGRVTIFQQTMPTSGPGVLKPRENPNARAGDVATQSLNPSTDFYKKLALEASAHQIAMDFFFMNSQYIDIATLSCASRFSAGDLHYYPGLHVKHNPLQADRLLHDLDRYLTRKIGFEAVMRIRCTKGLAIHTFHGNFFVRSTDLLALANINPDAGFGLNLSIEESLADLSSICIQAALLYTSSKGERRIRVHTMCFPVAKQIGEIFNSVDTDAVISLLSKMAVDRSVTASVSDARDALVNATVDALKAYRESISPGSVDSSLLVPPCMKTYPLAISCLLKHPAFRGGVSTRLDDRVFSMIDLKMQPASYVLRSIHPDLYRIDNMTDEGSLDIDERIVPQPPLLPLSAESMDRGGVYLLDTGWHLYLHIDPHTSQEFLQNVVGVKQYSNIELPMYSLPDLENPQSESFHNFFEWLQDQRPHYAPLQVVRADSREHYFFMLYMRQDKTESSMSFLEFLQHVKQQMIK